MNKQKDAVLDSIEEALKCGRTLRNIMGGNVGGGACIYEEALTLIPALQEQLTPSDDVQEALDALDKLIRNAPMIKRGQRPENHRLQMAGWLCKVSVAIKEERAALKSSPVDVDVDDIIEKMQSEIQLLCEAIIVNKG